MHIKCLQHVEYDPTGRSYQSYKNSKPTWEDVESSIRRLDRFRFPFVWLWATDDSEKQTLDGEGDVFTVMGGEGAYWLAGSFNGFFERRIDYPERGDSTVEVWTSDQGMTTLERHVCRDLEAVIRAVKYFSEHRDFDPALRWGKGP